MASCSCHAPNLIPTRDRVRLLTEMSKVNSGGEVMSPESPERVLARSLSSLLVQSFTVCLIECLRVPGARTPARLATWTKDTPELKLNLSLVVEAFLQVLASGLGALALVWATVVLLGGFSAVLGTVDFWFTTAVVFVETARIVGYNSAPEARFFVDVSAALYQEEITGAGVSKFVWLLTMGPAWIALAPVFFATACVSLSTIRLLGIAASAGARHSTSTSSSSSNMKPALILFYALVLTQGALFLLCFAVAVVRSLLAAQLNLLYLLKLPHQSRRSGSSRRKQLMIDRYVSSIADTSIQKGVAATINTNLVSFASELLLSQSQSQHPDDRTDAVLVLHSLVIQSQDRSDGAIEQICSSGNLPLLVSGLLLMLRHSRNNDDLVGLDIKTCITEIVAKLACRLRLVDIPGAAHCISSSLLDPHLMKTTAETCLFVRGLVILRELAADPENLTEMYNTMDLVPKTLAPVSSGLHHMLVGKSDATAVEIVRESLRVVAKLTSGTTGRAGESARRLCHELTMTKHGRRAAENILWILRNSSDQEMRMLAVEILSRLTTLDEPIMLRFSADLQRLLFDPQDNPLRIEAGKTLIALVASTSHGDVFLNIQQLVRIMSSDACSKEYRAVTAEILAQMSARPRADHQDRIINRLSSVANAFPTVLEAIVTETTNITGLDDTNSSKFLASFLDLAVQIREKLVTAEAFADAVTGLPMGNKNNIVFAETLNRIIKMTTGRRKGEQQDEVWLAIIKSAAKLVTWMTEIDTISPGYYIADYFRQEYIVEELEYAAMAMAHLERYVVMTGGADEKEGYVTLQTLVETTKDKLVPQQPLLT